MKPKDLYGLVALAIRVNKIVTVVNRRYVRASRAYNGGSADGIAVQRARFAKAEHYAKDSNRREAELLKYLPASLGDRDLEAVWREANEGSHALSEMCAEDASEAAMFGDGPCGSMERRNALGGANALALACYAEHKRRNPEPEPEPVAPGADEIPF